MSLQNDNCWEANSQQIKKMLLKMEVLSHTLYIRIRAEYLRGYMKAISVREEAKQQNPWD